MKKFKEYIAEAQTKEEQMNDVTGQIKKDLANAIGITADPYHKSLLDKIELARETPPNDDGSGFLDIILNTTNIKDGKEIVGLMGLDNRGAGPGQYFSHSTVSLINGKVQISSRFGYDI